MQFLTNNLNNTDKINCYCPFVSVCRVCSTLSLQANFHTYWRSCRPILADFMITKDLGNPFLLILWLLKILATHSSWYYAYWRSWRTILADFFPTEDLGDLFLLILWFMPTNRQIIILVSFQFPKTIILVMFQKASVLVSFQNR